ncbi:hypothetical protein P7C73_g2562, partial [Tremellales sp. Uapishka_1]
MLSGNALLYTITVLTGLGFLLVGYDNGVMGGIVNNAPFQNTFPRTKTDATLLGTIVAIYEIGCCVGALITSVIGERFGRRKTIFTGALIMLGGTAFQAGVSSPGAMIGARIVSGLGMGAINSTVPVLQAEVSPQATRGRFVCAQLSLLNFGILTAYWVGYAFSTVSGTNSTLWRVPVALQAVFIIPIMGLCFIVPESPRWTAAHGRPEESLAILARLQGKPITHQDVLVQHQEVQDAVQLERSIGSGTWRDLLREDEIKSRKRLLIACGIQAMQQAGGINGLIYFAGTLLATAGLSPHGASLVAGCLFTWFFVASFIPWFLIDSFGRRKLLLTTITMMAICYAVEAGVIHQVQAVGSKAAGGAAVAFLFLYLGCFTTGFQAVVWVYPSEILPLRLRQKGSSLSTACNWIINYAVVQITPIAVKNIGYKYYIVFAPGVCAAHSGVSHPGSNAPAISRQRSLLASKPSPQLESFVPHMRLRQHGAGNYAQLPVCHGPLSALEAHKVGNIAPWRKQKCTHRARCGGFHKVLSNDGTLYLDLYLPPPLSVAPTSPPESLFASSPITHNTAPDIDSASDTGSQSDDWRLVPPDPESPSPVPTSQAQHQDLPELHIPRDETFSGKKTMIFVYDVGMMGPIRPRKEMFCLLGIKLAELGYHGGAEQMVGDLRQVLNWVSRNIQAYGGSSNDINICGHGLGAHLAMFTLAQDAVVRSRDKKQEREIHRVLPSRLWGNEEKIVPNGLRTMQIYSEEVEIPTVAGIILLSPIADIIKQIRHESLGWLEHVSPVRRALGPSQTVCMQDSLGHLLFAAKNVLEPERMPKHVMIIHGGHDTVVPLESSHWLSEVLNGLDIKTTFRPYFSLGHLDLLTSLMKGLEKEFTEVLLHDFQT